MYPEFTLVNDIPKYLKFYAYDEVVIARRSGGRGARRGGGLEKDQIPLDTRSTARHLERMDAGLTLGKLIGPIAAVLCLAAIPARAEPVSIAEAGSAQTQMQTKALAAINAYAKLVYLDQSWVSYCWTETNKQAEHATDGSIPFGLSYRGIERSTLDMTMEIKGAWIKNRTILCLAQAKGDLARASEAANADSGSKAR
ncbi:hypothetical protein MKK69_12875 [Methylobacterium sp. J-026]|uniref:hypothetical protein n=1 Tax=Methylobacterium sp. J-026 TaxID=2836624 RepID=UPI001FB9A886|nr:hypothetical protein [Methylobacterium sp. J-026]MCJ2134945.1 hypothetical protein [Methylobacterium sp. J-026]